MPEYPVAQVAWTLHSILKLVVDSHVMPATLYPTGAADGTVHSLGRATHCRPDTSPRASAQSVFALASPLVKSVANVITAPLTDATTRSEPLGPASHVVPLASANCRIWPAVIVASSFCRVTVLAASSMAATVNEVATICVSPSPLTFALIEYWPLLLHWTAVAKPALGWSGKEQMPVTQSSSSLQCSPVKHDDVQDPPQSRPSSSPSLAPLKQLAHSPAVHISL